MYTNNLGLLNNMAFGLLDLLGHKTPSEEELRSVERFLNNFVITPYPLRERETLDFEKKLADLRKREKKFAARFSELMS